MIRTRYRTRTRLGDENKPEMVQAIHAHANAAEYIPIGLILLLMARWLGANLSVVHAVGATLTAGRLLHAAAFLRSDFWDRKTLPRGRFCGMVLTLVSILIGIAACLWLAVTAPA